MKALLLLFIIALPVVPAQADTIPVLAFVSPDNSFAVITSLIANATNTIYLAVYSFSNPRLLKALNDAIARGVEVYVILEDHHVTYFEDKYTLYAAYNLTLAGAYVHRAPTDYNYMHAKYLVVDNSTVMVFTGNFAKTSVPYDPSYGNRERGVIIYDSSIARFFASVFLEDFSRGTPYDTSQGTGSEVSDYVEHGSYSHPFSYAKLEVSRIMPFVLPNASIIDTYVSLIESANESIDVEIAYADFRRDSIDNVNPLISALVDAASRGVNVRVIIGFYNDEQASLALYLRDHGIRVARGPTEDNAQDLPVDAIFAAIHTKTMIIDNKIVVISSANRSENAFLNNREAGVIIRSSDLASYYSEVFQRDREHSLVKPPLENEDYLSVRIISPSNGSIIEDNLTLTLEVNSSLPGSISVYANNTLVASENFSVGLSRINITLSLEDGKYEVKVVAQAGNLVSKAYLYVSIISSGGGGEEKVIDSIRPGWRYYAIILIGIAIIAIKKARKR